MYNRKLFVILLLFVIPEFLQDGAISERRSEEDGVSLEGVSTEVQGTKELVSDCVIDY